MCLSKESWASQNVTCNKIMMTNVRFFFLLIIFIQEDDGLLMQRERGEKGIESYKARSLKDYRDCNSVY